MKALTPEEVLKVLKAASESKRNHAAILLAWRHGMRAQEICNLRLSDVDLKNGQITIRRLKGSLTTTQALTDLPGQPLLSEKRALKAWLAERRDSSDFVFTSQKGGQLDRSAFFRAFQAAAREAGLPPDKQHPHTLKHGLGYALVAQNVNLAIVRQALGHRSLQSTAVYTVPSPEQVDKAVTTAIANLF